MISNTEINKLGNYLKGSSNSDEDTFRDIYRRYIIKLSLIQSSLDATFHYFFPEFEVSGRVKTLRTTIEKLHRYPTMKLATMDDAVGIRIVGRMTLDEQDKAAKQLQENFEISDVNDRRIESQNGYRALHVVLKVDGQRVEVQIRTYLQAAWANAFERLADEWGRQIRYGGAPNPDIFGKIEQRQKFMNDLIEFSDQQIRRFEDEKDDIHKKWNADQISFQQNRVVKKPKNKQEVIQAMYAKKAMEWKKEIVSDMAEHEVMLNRVILELSNRARLIE